MSLHLLRSEVDSTRRLADDGCDAHVVYGLGSSMALVTRRPGHRGTPVAFTGEQVVCGVTGQVWLLMLTRDNSRSSVAIGPGDFVRVPPLAIHWFVNHSDVAATTIEFHTPGIQGHALYEGARGHVAPWETGATPDSGHLFRVDPARYPIDELDALAANGSTTPTTDFRGAADVPEYLVDRGYTTPLRTKLAYSRAGSVMWATRPPGYHSTPHIHHCEQLNIVLEGEIHGYLLDPSGEGHAFHLREGDFWRVPELAVHWSWNRGDGPVTLVEYHAPGMQHDPVLGRLSCPLFDPAESTVEHSPLNLFVDPVGLPLAQTESATVLTA